MGKHQAPHLDDTDNANRKEGTPLVDPRNEGEVEINDMKCRALIDSGAQITSITHSFWYSHPELQKQKLQTSNITIEGAAAQNVPYYVSHIRLKVFDEDCMIVPTFVVPDSEYRSSVPLLIGTNLIRATKSHLQAAYGTEFLHLIKESHPEWYTAVVEVETTENHNKQGIVGPAVYTGRTVRIPAGKEMDLKCKIKAGPQRKTYTALIEGLDLLQLPQDLLEARVLTNIKKGMPLSES